MDALYLELRSNYKSLMISLGIHRSRSEDEGGQLRELSKRAGPVGAGASVTAEVLAACRNSASATSSSRLIKRDS